MRHHARIFSGDKDAEDEMQAIARHRVTRREMTDDKPSKIWLYLFIIAVVAASCSVYTSNHKHASVAQLDRASAFYAVCCRFESCRAHHSQEKKVD